MSPDYRRVLDCAAAARRRSRTLREDARAARAQATLAKLVLSVVRRETARLGRLRPAGPRAG